MKIAILGSKGMLGADLKKVFFETEHEIFPFTRDDLDITNLKEVKEKLINLSPEYVINSAAFTDVDGCESSPHLKELSYDVNGLGVKNLAEVCYDIGATLVHYSTDYVFDGERKTGYDESHQILKPINAYGYSKALGEAAIGKIQKLVGPANFKYYLIRPSWLFGGNGKNFVSTMVNLGKEKNELNVVNDQFGKPTYTLDLAKSTLDLIKAESPYGIYHMTNNGECSWYDFASEIFRQLGWNHIKVNPILSKDYPSKTARPKHSCLNNTKLTPMRSWEDALADYLKTIK